METTKAPSPTRATRTAVVDEDLHQGIRKAGRIAASQAVRAAATAFDGLWACRSQGINKYAYIDGRRITGFAHGRAAQEEATEIWEGKEVSVGDDSERAL